MFISLLGTKLELVRHLVKLSILTAVIFLLLREGGRTPTRALTTPTLRKKEPPHEVRADSILYQIAARQFALKPWFHVKIKLF